MRIPTPVAHRVLNGNAFGFKCLADGTIPEGFQSGWGETAYPPLGYLPWNIFEVGNGDTYGYYWPIGKESEAPIVCTILHDAWAIVPVASSLDACVRLLLLTEVGDVDELMDTAKNFGIEIDDIPLPERDSDGEVASLDGPPWTNSESSGIEFWGAPSAVDLLKLDPNSPHLRYVAAKEAIAKRQLAEAENHLQLALSLLPEYSEAWAMLAQLYRQQRDQPRAAEALMKAITAPLCFGATDRKKLLNWLQRMDDSVYPDCPDPLWDRRGDLTFADGVKENDDYRIFEELIDEYHRVGQGVRAVQLRVMTGERMSHETVSFRERRNWTGKKYRTLLRSDLERAGLHERSAAL